MSILRTFCLAVALAVVSLVGDSAFELRAQTKVTIGSQLSAPFANLVIADKAGMFKAHGLDVRLITFASAAELTTAILSGNVDYAFTGAAPVFPLYAKGEKVKIFVSTVNAPAYVLMGAKDVTSLAEAVQKGAITGVSGLGSLDYYVIRWIVAKQGLDPNKLKFVSAGPPGIRARALLAGRLGLTASLPPDSYELQNQGAVTLADMGSSAKVIPLEVGWATEKKLADQPDTTKAIVNALVDASVWMNKNPDEALRLMIASLKTAPDQVPNLKKALEYYGQYWIKKGELIDEPGLRIFLGFFVEGKVIKPEDTEAVIKGIYTNAYLK